MVAHLSVLNREPESRESTDKSRFLTFSLLSSTFGLYIVEAKLPQNEHFQSMFIEFNRFGKKSIENPPLTFQIIRNLSSEASAKAY